MRLRARGYQRGSRGGRIRLEQGCAAGGSGGRLAHTAMLRPPIGEHLAIAILHPSGTRHLWQLAPCISSHGCCVLPVSARFGLVLGSRFPPSQVLFSSRWSPCFPNPGRDKQVAFEVSVIVWPRTHHCLTRTDPPSIENRQRAFRSDHGTLSSSEGRQVAPQLLLLLLPQLQMGRGRGKGGRREGELRLSSKIRSQERRRATRIICAWRSFGSWRCVRGGLRVK